MVVSYNVYTHELEIMQQGQYTYEYYLPSLTNNPEMKDKRRVEYDKYRAIQRPV